MPRKKEEVQQDLDEERRELLAHIDELETMWRRRKKALEAVVAALKLARQRFDQLST